MGVAWAVCGSAMHIVPIRYEPKSHVPRIYQYQELTRDSPLGHPLTQLLAAFLEGLLPLLVRDDTRVGLVGRSISNVGQVKGFLVWGEQSRV